MIENTLLYFKTKTAFNTQLEADNIKNDSITFIQDTKQIWTHGTYFDCDNSAGNIKVSDELAASAGVTDKNVEAMLSALVVGYNWFYEKALPSKQDVISDLETIRQGAAKGATALQTHQDISGKADKSSLAAVATSGSYNDLSDKPTIPSYNEVTTNSAGLMSPNDKTKLDSLATVAISGSYDDLLNAPTLPSSTSPLPIDSGGTGSNNAEDACDNIGAVKKYDIFKTLSKEGWYRIGLLTAIMSTSSARIIVGGTNADVTPIIMDFQHNFRGNMLSQMPTVMTPLYVTKVRAVRYTSDDVYIDLYFTNVSSSHTTVRVIPYEGTFEPMDYVDVTNEAVTVLTSIDIIKDGFLADKLTKDEAETTYQPIGNYVTLDTEQTITGKKYINDTTFRFKNSENTIETVVTNRAISMQPMDGVEKPSSTLSVQSMTGGKLHITNANSKNQTVWPKQLSITNLKYDTQDRCGVYIDSDENRQQVIVGYFKNVNGVFYTLASLSTGKYVEIMADCLYLHSGASSDAELNAAAFNWDNTTNTLDIKRAYYNNGSIETGDAKLTLNGKKVATVTDVINHGTSDASFALTPNTYHVWGTMSSLTLTLSTPVDTTVYNEYMFEFTSGSTATTLSLPSTIKWVDAPSIEANKTYQVSIVNNLGVIAGFAAI